MHHNWHDFRTSSRRIITPLFVSWVETFRCSASSQARYLRVLASSSVVGNEAGFI